MFKTGSSAVSIVITIASKAIGFAREMVLLSVVGISYGLDIFVLFFGFASLLASLVGICVVTNLTPVMSRMKDKAHALDFTIEGVKVGALFTALAWAGCVAYAQFAVEEVEFVIAYKLAIIIPVVVFFSIITEYHVSIFLSENRQIPVIVGNVMVSVPIVVAMLIFETSIVSYSVLLVAAFALRSLIFFALLYRPPGDGFSWRAAVRRRPVVLTNARRVFAGGSAMLAYSLVSLLAIAVAHRMGVGAAALLGYALKIPLLVLTSLWFVLGSRFFSRIVQDKGAGAVRLMLRLTGLNAAVAVVLAVAVGLFQLVLHLFPGDLSGVTLDFVKVVSASLPLLPIIVLVPIVEMSQRILSTWNDHDRVPIVGAVILVVASLGFVLAVMLQSILVTMLALTGALIAGAVVAVITLNLAAELRTDV